MQAGSHRGILANRLDARLRSTPCPLHGSAREIEPRFAEIVTKAVRSGRPDHDGCGIGDRLEPNLTLKQAFFSALSFSDVAIYRVIRNLLARGGRDWNRAKRHMNSIPILATTHPFAPSPVARLPAAECSYG